jgi:glycerophosphoryl diester phosphodiesterase
VVVFHDKTLLRMCQVDTKLADLNYHELPRLVPEAMSALGMDQHSQCTNEQPEEIFRIPLFSEVLKAIPLTTPVFVEVSIVATTCNTKGKGDSIVLSRIFFICC